ncbi:unnamed protein product [Brugia timori]|uniref:PKcGMP_CC domain-containing protein n=1 Tax=Brugia timori TaxID=42155 RepID=A0A0R3QZ79_9BILA|nr:unnamed protein product [Brugia timori]
MDEKGTTCPITNATVIATTSLRPTVPDRQAFQQELRNYNQSISETVAKVMLKTVWRFEIFFLKLMNMPFSNLNLCLSSLIACIADHSPPVLFIHSFTIGYVYKIDRIIGRNNTIGTLNMLKQSKQEPCKRREQLKVEADGMKIEINEIKKLLTEKNALLSDIENDLVYKDESRLTARLEELEIAYSQTKFTSSRTEKALVKEIDKLKRNRAKLAQVF